MAALFHSVAVKRHYIQPSDQNVSHSDDKVSSLHYRGEQGAIFKFYEIHFM